MESAGRAAEEAELTDDRSPLHPMRVYAELKPLLDRDAIVVIDAGDFGSYAGRVIDSYVPGAWLDSGPFGCLGSGPGYALAAKLARPDRQVVLLQGDGAFGFSGMEWDTLVRHGVHVVSVIGNNGIWALEKHPMELLYGYSVVAELRPGTRYDEVVTALGGHGELVSTPAELRPALRAGVRVGRACGGQHADRPAGRLPAPVESGLTASRPPRERACLRTTRRANPDNRARSRCKASAPEGRASVRKVRSITGVSCADTHARGARRGAVGGRVP